MRGTSLKITGLGVLAALAAAPSAQAALGGGEHFDAKNGPDLRTVTVLQDPEANNRTELVRFCFDRRLQPEDIAPDDIRNRGFRLYGYDSDFEVRSIRATLDQGREDSDAERCVIVEFPDGTDTSRFTVGHVDDNVVFAASGGNQGNLEDSVPTSSTLEKGL
ncbi:MAG TPA: hypothetical protein VD931_16895, partial [Baekduia sp.]|nr:hypothetical protein [Baekduia sp.]